MESSLQQIKDASTGLLYMSESDYPFEVLSLNGTPISLVGKLVELSGKGKGTRVDVITPEQFFKNMTRLSPDPSPEQRQAVQHFVTLQQVLQEKLSDIAVYLIGEVEIEAFIIGKLDNGTYAGLRTKVIQT